MYDELVSQLSVLDSSSKGNRPYLLNRAVDFEVVDGAHWMLHTFKRVKVHLTEPLIKLLSMNLRQISFDRLPHTLHDFVREDKSLWLKDFVMDDRWLFRKNVRTITVIGNLHKSQANILMSSLQNVLAKSPWLIPRCPIVILVSDIQSAFSDAQKWHIDFPELGGAIFGRSIIYLSCDNLDRLLANELLMSALVHELFHAKIADHTLILPRWLEEGMAEVLAAHYLKNDVDKYRAALTIDECLQIEHYIQSGLWRSEHSPLTDASFRPTARLILIKFLYWLWLRVGWNTLLSPLHRMSLLYPWEHHFYQLTGVPLIHYWYSFARGHVCPTYPE